ncbi:MAG TPA: NHLP bacteriocin export ABC transporter permease/ATPase subunit [Coleofasciculaceae cyanobacterium]|jgi:NHLM bacteriocin system ABC transporter ATP-binding protein
MLPSPNPPQVLKGNTPLLLNDEGVVWQVQSGSLALFLSLIDHDQPQGKRRYLFTVTAGEALFGFLQLQRQNATTQSWGILAIALEETKLQPIAISDFLTPDLTLAASSLSLAESWIQHWSTWLSQQSVIKAVSAGKRLQTSSSPYLSLLQQQSVQAQRGTIRWVQIVSGTAQWMGQAALPLKPDSAVFPLMADTWLEAETPVEIQLVPIAEIPVFSESLSQFHRYLGYLLMELEQAALESEFHRFQERERLNQQVTTSAMQELVAPLERSQAVSFQEGSPLLVAVGAIAHTLGMAVRPPATSEDPSRLRDPLEAIARASRFQTRQVQLVGRWWTKEYGPLLAYRKDGQPVALLQERSDRYLLFDPIRLDRIPVDQALAEEIGNEAYMFYRPLPESIRHTLDIMRFALRGYQKDVALIVLIGVVVSLIGMLVPQVMAILINDAIPSGNHALVWQLGLALFAVACSRTALALTQGILSLRIERAADSVLQLGIWDRLLQLPPRFFRPYAIGDLLVRTMAVRQIRSILSYATQQTLLNAMFALLNLGLMLFYSVKLTLVGISITLLTAGVSSISSLVLLRQVRQQEALQGKISGLSVQLISNVAKLRVAVAEERAFAAWSKLFSQQTRLQVSTQQLGDELDVILEALPTLSSVLIFWFAAASLQTTAGQPPFSLGVFLAFSAAYGTFLGGIVSLSSSLTDVLQIVPLWERAQPIFSEKPESDLSQADPGRLIGQMQLDHVTFRYREDGPLILDDVCLSAAPGEFVAIVGPSGSGKSTLLRILLKFEHPLSGTVYYDGQDLAGLDIGAVRRQLGVVLQNGRIGAGSIFDNITGGALVSLDEVWEAAEMAGFAEDVRQMPMEMHTVVSEGGMNLSGGQRQRLLIARAIVLKPQIILLDEATSALDNRTQAIVAHSLECLNTTRIVIAHRLSTIRNADRIYVMEAGRVVQNGKFDELLTQEGLFARLVARQLD